MRVLWHFIDTRNINIVICVCMATSVNVCVRLLSASNYQDISRPIAARQYCLSAPPSLPLRTSPDIHMSSVDSATSPSSNFEALFNAALEECIKQKGIDLADHPLAAKIDACGTVADVLDVFQEQAQAFDEFRTGDPRLIKCLKPVVGGLNSLCSSSTLSSGASIVSVRVSRDSLSQYYKLN